LLAPKISWNAYSVPPFTGVAGSVLGMTEACQAAVTPSQLHVWFSHPCCRREKRSGQGQWRKQETAIISL